MTDSMYRVKLQWVPAKVTPGSMAKQFQLERGLYHEEYTSVMYLKAPTFAEAEARALEIAQERFPDSLRMPSTCPTQWTRSTTTKVTEDDLANAHP